MSLSAQPRREGLGRRAAFLTVASFSANLLAYLMSLALSRALGPAEYGGMAAILALAVIGTIPSQSEQFLAARGTATLGGQRTGTRRAWLVGLAAAGVCAVLSVPLGAALHLPSSADLAILGLVLLPLTVAGAHLGALLGTGRSAAFGLLLVALSGGRFLAALLTIAWGGGVTEFLLLAAAATWATLGVAWAVTRRLPPAHTAPGWHDLLPAVSALAAVYVITSIDVVGARLLLSPHDSGDYAVAGLFSRIAFWGPYAIVLVVFPMVARAEGGRRLLAGALGVTLGAGATLALGAAALAGPFIDATSGPTYESAADLAPWMALLGCLGACLQLLLMHALARRSRHVEVSVWLALCAEIVMLVLLRPASPGGIIAVAVSVQLVAALVAGTVEWRRTPGEDPE